MWFRFLDADTTLTGLPTDLNQWVILNSKGRMMYRVHYDDASRNAIVAQLDSAPQVREIIDVKLGNAFCLLI